MADNKEHTDAYEPVEITAESVDNSVVEDGVVMSQTSAEVPARDLDRIKSIMLGLQVGTEIMVELGTDDVQAIHEGKVVSQEQVKAEPYDWDTVVAFDIPPEKEGITRRYIAGQFDVQVGRWYVVSYDYEAPMLNAIDTESMIEHGWIIDIAYGQ
jgi:hypothetical protein